MNMYVYMYICLYISIYTSVYTHTHTYIYIYIYIYICIYIYIYIYIYTIYMCIHSRPKRWSLWHIFRKFLKGSNFVGKVFSVLRNLMFSDR